MTLVATESPYDDDESHPIPYVGKIDVVVTTNVAIRLGVVIASPLRCDERSKLRLVQKLESYVREFAIRRDEWAIEKARSAQAVLYIAIHPESDPEMLQMVDDYQQWIEGNSIRVVISKVAR